MENQEEKLPPELKEKLLEVELAAEENERKNPRFDTKKAATIGLLSFGMGFTLGIGLRGGVVNSLIFAIFSGACGFLCGGCQRPKKK